MDMTLFVVNNSSFLPFFVCCTKASNLFHESLHCSLKLFFFVLLPPSHPKQWVLESFTERSRWAWCREPRPCHPFTSLKGVLAPWQIYHLILTQFVFFCTFCPYSLLVPNNMQFKILCRNLCGSLWISLNLLHYCLETKHFAFFLSLFILPLFSYYNDSCI